MAPQIPPSSPPPHPKEEKKRNIYKYIGSPVETTPPSVYTILFRLYVQHVGPLCHFQKPYTQDDKKNFPSKLIPQKVSPQFSRCAGTHTLQNELWLKNMIWYILLGRVLPHSMNDTIGNEKTWYYFSPLLLPATVLFPWECGWIDKHNEKKEEKSLLSLSLTGSIDITCEAAWWPTRVFFWLRKSSPHNILLQR
jgi:hypothetical protein